MAKFLAKRRGDDSIAGATGPRERGFIALMNGRLSCSTRTFRDPDEGDIDSTRRFSAGTTPRNLARATRFRSTPESTYQQGAAASSSAGGEDSKEIFGSTSGGRRWSLHEWLSMKSINKTEAARNSAAEDEVSTSEQNHHLRCGSGDDILSEDDVSTRNDDDEVSSQFYGTKPSSPRTKQDLFLRTSESSNREEDRGLKTDIEDIYAGTAGEGTPRRLPFLSGTMSLTVDTSNPTQLLSPDKPWQQEQAGDDEDQSPASPCSGVLLETSPRYGTLQAFRKEMSSRGVNAQMFRTKWGGKLLRPRDIVLFMTDSRRNSVIFWRSRKKTSGRGGSRKLGTAGRLVIPLSSLANIGPAELYPPSAAGARDRAPWLSIMSSLRRRDGAAVHCKAMTSMGQRTIEKEGTQAGLPEVPILALSYWVDGKPRWVGDHPKRLLVKPESLDSFRRLNDGLRLCCLHFNNYACPQDLEDIC